eukprot:13087901-Alexandrium_andersonii.AAC.1
MTYDELRALLRQRHLGQKGRKDELIDRLTRADEHYVDTADQHLHVAEVINLGAQHEQPQESPD